MTVFKQPLGIGQETGAPTTDTRLSVGGVKTVDVSAGGKSATRTIPANSTFVDVNCIVSAVPTSVTQGLTVRIGTSASPTAYGVINNVVNGFNRGTINAFGPISGTVVFDVTASVSAADFNAGIIRVRPLFAPEV